MSCTNNKINNMCCTNNKTCTDLNGNQTSCEKCSNGEKEDDCSLTFLNTGYDDHSSCSLTEEEENEILMSLGGSETFGDENDLFYVDGQELGNGRYTLNGGSICGLVSVPETVYECNIDLTDEDTEEVKKAVDRLAHTWGKRRCRLGNSMTTSTESFSLGVKNDTTNK
mmetsp:Transcript_4523/g.6777  ORF Transcript_4523/g.6777 Transcript_4523/m.6777 type:complete len:168 (-) Transcript_4523:38-541(-)